MTPGSCTPQEPIPSVEVDEAGRLEVPFRAAGCWKLRHRRISRLNSFLASFAWVSLQVGPTPAVAHEFDPVLYWLIRLSIGSALAGIVTAIILVFTQRRLGETVLKALSLGGFVFLPLLLLGMSSLVSLAQAKKVEFCRSCHRTMGAFVRDMEDRNSETLAARHARHRWIPEDQCYLCHTAYGMFGDVKAKMKGLEDLYSYYSRTYHLPVRMHAPYPNSDCLKCHEHTPKFVELEHHVELLPGLRSGEFRCVDCHGPAHAEQVTNESSLRR